ncbi:DUF2642 domain-containing protein [Brevibacillus brevis]|uniref:DUF2642 domain-containing protein n=1 Tax=Brevibacillus brevis TaxID=1393 RepID=UPI000D0F3A93|nr:DUF2642 domain-containing protein [Brevibacillus brevis]PSJ67777.1 DUF2642 domain-containing protein [Brevibacillus brevis]RED22820.1 hypothetical protein DES34_11629 [Brevibacillus brevis]GEC92884.1 hypothetical protein BBR01nite_52150 [Brevibacillus brevis]VEF87693.1 Uncharacterised protein [Brevibacillus brevis]
MKLIVNEQELKEYFRGLRSLVWGKEQTDEGLGNDKEEAIRSSLRKELYAEEFAAFLQESHSDLHSDSFRKVLLRYLHETVELGTDAGSVTGVLNEVGRDYAEIIEPSGTRVLIRFAQINYVHEV